MSAVVVAVAKCKLVGQHKMHPTAATFHACLAFQPIPTNYFIEIYNAFCKGLIIYNAKFQNHSCC